MKALLFACVGLMTVATNAFARIGEDEQQIKARYGEPGKDLGTHGEIHEVGYVSGGFLILVDFVNGISQREAFTKPDTSSLTDQNIKDILAMSAAEGTTWQEVPGHGGDKSWKRSDKKALAVFPAIGKFLSVQDVNFVQPK